MLSKEKVKKIAASYIEKIKSAKMKPCMFPNTTEAANKKLGEIIGALHEMRSEVTGKQLMHATKTLTRIHGHTFVTFLSKDLQQIEELLTIITTKSKTIKDNDQVACAASKAKAWKQAYGKTSFPSEGYRADLTRENRCRIVTDSGEVVEILQRLMDRLDIIKSILEKKEGTMGACLLFNSAKCVLKYTSGLLTDRAPVVDIAPDDALRTVSDGLVLNLSIIAAALEYPMRALHGILNTERKSEWRSEWITELNGLIAEIQTETNDLLNSAYLVELPNGVDWPGFAPFHHAREELNRTPPHVKHIKDENQRKDIHSELKFNLSSLLGTEEAELYEPLKTPFDKLQHDDSLWDQGLDSITRKIQELINATSIINSLHMIILRACNGGFKGTIDEDKLWNELILSFAAPNTMMVNQLWDELGHLTTWNVTPLTEIPTKIQEKAMQATNKSVEEIITELCKIIMPECEGLGACVILEHNEAKISKFTGELKTTLGKIERIKEDPKLHILLPYEKAWADWAHEAYAKSVCSAQENEVGPQLEKTCISGDAETTVSPNTGTTDDSQRTVCTNAFPKPSPESMDGTLRIEPHYVAGNIAALL